MREKSEARTFRLKKSILYQGIGFSIFFSIVICLYVWLGFFIPPAAPGAGGPNVSVMILGMIVFGPMLIGSLCMWRAYYVEQLTIDGSLISLRSLTQNHHFDVSEIQSLAWSAFPRGGSLRIQLAGSKARLSLHGFSPKDRQVMIAILHAMVPEPLQENWPKFCHRIAIPLRDGYFPNAEMTPIEQIEREAKRRQLIRTMVLTVSTIGLLSTPVLINLGVDKETALIVGVVVLLAGVFGFIPFLPRVKTKWSEEDEELAVRLWDEGESVSAAKLMTGE
ncbi:hypothetical protein Pan97_02840 [Bremerella volcania]|uniref:FACT complex subunit SSRP1/POB3 N-terminal PH domain-containing protein n=1 Tax=Bremerella volcania TaxID=2527984 RepID=A0A518C258_9BACT|nr:hypothetical protein [Bremerella volcania]QDU73315.1 hypothetical protein Pan97_02840 [Bremerella volcania]